MSEVILYRWPAAARFGRVVPKTKFYERGGVSASARDLFVTEVQRITWAYKLADATIHLRGSDEVPEIQVFVIDAKGDEVSDTVLAAIDRSVPFPIVFEVTRAAGAQAETRMVAAYKRLDGKTPRLAPYVSTPWAPSGCARQPLPTALDLAGLYAALLGPLLPLDPLPGERLAEMTVRLEQARKLERQIVALERRMGSEPQLNRKIELRRQVRALSVELAELTAPAPLTAPEPLTAPAPLTAEPALGKGTPWTS
ncbi:DUF4391 domain-containing protein [Aquihabitans sp. McL0605]|uniref:DUF4391 domain-containing protein n=1 Tax=Aquihabitans sp. McL0605 TaxID=3415671 RepID=UPI003CE6AC37